MTDLSWPNTVPGPCCKCDGSGVYRWSKVVNSRVVLQEGDCYSCRGTGRQDRRQIARNVAYNRHNIGRVLDG
jgi:DnaJ-class molecular chaperone